MGLFDFLKKNGNTSQTDVPIARNCLHEYVVFDIESTGLSRYYSEIVQLSAIKIQNGQIVGKFDKLVKPRKPIPEDAIAIHHISNEMVSSAPTFVEIIDEFLAFVGNSVLVGYNISGFDLFLLNNRLYFERDITLNTKYIDVLNAARRLPISNHKLTSVAEFYGFGTEDAHNALFDCIMTDKCYRALSSAGYNLTISEFRGPIFKFHTPTKLSQSSQAILVLRSIMSNIVADGKVEDSEFNELVTWVRENENLKGEYPFDSISEELTTILDDGIVQPSELDELASFIDEWLDPIGHARHTPIVTLRDVHVVLTGDFEYGGIGAVEGYVLEKGAIIDNSTTKKTQLVIVGAHGSKAWVAGNYGNKIKKALENRAKGQKIEIITEYEFFKETAKLS